MTRAVLFDVGNTLILASPRFWLLPFLEERGLKPKRDPKAAALAAFRFYEDHHLEARDLETALGLWREFHRRLFTWMGLEDHAEALSRELVARWKDPATWPLVPGAEATLKALKAKGYPLAVVSNWDATLPEILEVVGLRRYFDHLSVSALSGYAKPDPRLFREALEALGVSPEEAVHVGDAEADLLGAEAVGMRALLFDPLGENPKALPRLERVLDYLP
ncbi:hydrolase [Thermus scotoductus]|uniref:Hydrolase n=1 Tax=Thermus scotoductus TaxID=37636 RepID=A0A430S7I9_THESC|nr:HAD family hydrolase [Thermus scotoductus]RTG94480.1 hydrolase [Thermus scotoductus]RTH06448.1 hydrolase [Thermus scotoductus]RTH09279.1 hydrolase [Thermus scotoductus]RTH09659.1 hydrolase [Thermus scotoductus]RTH16019.1 hydrolase [Thermus scotoductus]